MLNSRFFYDWFLLYPESEMYTYQLADKSPKLRIEDLG